MTSPGTPVALAAFRLSAVDPSLPDRLKLNAPDQARARDPSEWGIQRIWLFKSVRVDTDAGQYLYRFEPSDGAKEVREWKVAPWNPTGEPDFGKTLGVSIHSLRVKATEAWRAMAAHFEQALVDGAVVVAGRLDSPLAPFTLVPKDAWTHFRIQDWETGYAEGNNGECLYGLEIAPHIPTNASVKGATTGRRGSKRRRVIEMIDTLYPDGSHRMLSDKELFAAVEKHMAISHANEKLPSMRTLRRAAGRD